MNVNTALALGFILKSEGGYSDKVLKPYSNEPGGAVNRGITFDMYIQWCTKHGHPIPAPAPTGWAELKNLSISQTIQIYIDEMLTPLGFDNLPNAVDYCLLDFVVNSGLGGALEHCRTAFGLPEPTISYHTEPELLAALHGPVEQVLNTICDARWVMMQADPSFKTIAGGRMYRMNTCYNNSRFMASLVLPIPPQPWRYQLPTT